MPVSARGGMGAIAVAGGVTFRVWAPFAASVAVAGEFNGWDPSSLTLGSEGNGFWSGDVTGATTGQPYKFCVTGADGQMRWKTDPYALTVTNSDEMGNALVTATDFAWSARDYATPPWNEMVIYELHIGSFMADPANPGGHGDFAKAMEKLDYLADLGVNVLQVMPADEFAGDTSWGYNPSDIFAIENLYGGAAQFAAFVDGAHARGLAVIYDVVFNHFGPSDLFLWQFDGWSENGGGGIYFYNDWRKETPWGDTRPDYGRGEVRRFIRDNVLYWLETLRCDGLRFDATAWIRNVWGHDNDPGADLADGWSLLQWLAAEVAARQPWKLLIAEDMQDNPWITRPQSVGGMGFNAQWGAGFMHALRDCVISGDDGARDMSRLASVIRADFNGDPFQRVIYTESHDEVAADAGEARVPEKIWPGHADSMFSQKRSTLGAGLVMTAPGIPMIFMGQEFLSWGSWSDRATLDWTLAERFAGIHDLYRDLIRLRRNWFDTTRGLKGRNLNIHHINDTDKVMAFHRWDGGGARDDVLVIVNWANRRYDRYRVGVPREGLWRIRLNSDWDGYSSVFGGQTSFDQSSRSEPADGMPYCAEFGLGAYSILIASQDG